MAIFIASTKSISRGSGQSAVASASYRAGVALEDKRYDKTHDYSKKQGVMSADIILPTALAAANAEISRSDLWNNAESAEKRKDARVAREWLINLPHELSEQDRKELAHQFAQTLADRYGTIADCAIHKPTDKEIERGADPRNFHAHIMFTTRCAEIDDNNQILLIDKASIELSDNKRRSLGMERVSHEIKEVRQLWEQIANEKLAEHNHDLIDSRSYAEQGIDLLPQLKMGSVATKIERNAYEKAKTDTPEGEPVILDKPSTVRGEINQMIAERNRLVFSAELESNKRINDKADQIIFNSRKHNEREQINDQLRARTARTNAIGAHTAKNIDWADKRIASVKQRVSNNQSRIDRVNQNAGLIEHAVAISKQRIDDSKQAIERAARASEQANHIYERVARYDPDRIRKAKPAPSPFDDDVRRARAARLDRQQGRIDRDTRANRYEDERIFKSTERMKLHLAMRLIQRHRDDMAIRWAQGETAEDAPDKFDQRQVALLSEFVQHHGIENHDKAVEFTAHLHQVAKRFDDTLVLVENNKAIIKLLRDPKAEREQYLALIKHFIDFRDNIDQKRAAFNTSIIDKLGGSAGEVGRMTRDIISSFSYTKGLTNYINQGNYPAEARDVAREHLADTLDKTCQQFKLALRDVNSLPTTQRKTYSEALKATLEAFTEQYGKDLSESQHKALQGGLESYQHQVNKAHSSSRGFSL